jgi:hypothetical protein
MLRHPLQSSLVEYTHSKYHWLIPGASDGAQAISIYVSRYQPIIESREQ